MQIQITNNAIQSLRSGTYRTEMPDFYRLKGIVENNAWHLHQPVLDHSLLSAERLLQIMTSKQIPLESRSALVAYLAQDLDGMPKDVLFKIAVLLHDIGKITTLEIQPDGSTWCPGHAEVGAVLVSAYADIFGMTATQVAYVERIVRFHMVPFEKLGDALADGNSALHLDEIKRIDADHYPELLMLAYADMSGCELPPETVANYESRVDIIKNALDNYFSA